MFHRLLLIILLGSSVHSHAQEPRPNILFICVDDLNDWAGYLKGHPQSITPNLDQFAKEGITFTRAYCPAPACNPSRAAIMTGVRPSTSGVYINPQPWRKSPVLADAETLPQYFRRHGYKALGSGKVFHGRYPDPASWNAYWPALDQQRPVDPAPDDLPVNGIPNTRHFDWGPMNVGKEEMGDWQVADWVSSQLQQSHESPFFLACGFFRPHLPWYAPAEYFDRFPLDKIVLPKVMESDLDDIPQPGLDMINMKDHENVTRYKQWKKAVQGYLVSIHFMDDCLGKVLEALRASDHAGNTIVVLWSDHGWNLGEKHHWRKFALWENTTRTNLIIKRPGSMRMGLQCDQPVNLLDVYPTLLSLAGLPPNDKNEGTDLTPLLDHPNMQWLTPSITTHGKDNHAVRLGNWRYIHYADASEELYNLKSDVHEWTNLADVEAYQDIKAQLKKHLPSVNVDATMVDR
ncbi:MAG: sulfatase [Saprospiraceae bacterium]|nr:sulfatase [Saprospiraceae bacterium]